MRSSYPAADVGPWTGRSTKLEPGDPRETVIPPPSLPFPAVTSTTSSFQPVIRRVILRTPNAIRLAEFYQRTLGLVSRDDILNPQALSLFHPTTGEIVLTLFEEQDALPAPPAAPGLFHIAFLFPDLDGWRSVVRRAISLGESFHGASDHGVSWAVYLADVDGNGLELAWDKPSCEWPWRGDQIRMVSRSLPLRSILAGIDSEGGNADAFSIGHLHLQVADLKEVDTYKETLRLRVTQSDYPGALFLARDRYHHHLAINTWRTSPRISRPKHATGLVGWDMTRKSGSTAASWRDPSGSFVTLLPA